ncbi:hypothetical protein KY285_024017 [Solanum tuberosum]|nr:hypothetical protein KY289_024374 [Solanum tuberosum]KAH0676216.1 hypothetical protein KY285_024017 [Solanum tuberosum]
MAFKQTSRRFKHVNVSSSSSSNPTPKWQQEMTSMKSQLNALLSLYQKNIGNIPEEFAHLFPPPPQASDIESGAHQSPIGPTID